MSDNTVLLLTLILLFSSLLQQTFGDLHDPPLYHGDKPNGITITSCPVSNPAWMSPSGVQGAILTRKGQAERIEDTEYGKKGEFWKNATVSQMFWYSKSSTADAPACRNKCEFFTNNGAEALAYNEARGACAYWSYNANTGDCFLFDCTACKGASSYATGESEKGNGFVSGKGPQSCPLGSKVNGAPHFTGGDGSHFDFAGTPNHNYCLVSDSHLHINAYFGGRWQKNSNRPLNWIREVGLLWGRHTVRFVAREGARWQYDTGYMDSIEYDGKPVVLSQAGDSAHLAGGKLEIARVASRFFDGEKEIDVYELRIPGVVDMELRLSAEVASLRSPKDSAVHMDLSFSSLYVSTDNVHGVLGQTYRWDHAGRLAQQELLFIEERDEEVIQGISGEGFLDGTEHDYLASSLLKADCAMARYEGYELLDMEASLGWSLELTSKTHSKKAPRRALGATFAARR